MTTRLLSRKRSDEIGLRPFFPLCLALALGWEVGLLNYLDRQVIFSLFPLLQTEFKISAAALGLLTPAFWWRVSAVKNKLAGALI